MNLSTFFLALFTLIAFAANSIICRMALISGSIGAVDFTTIRLLSGIIVLLPVIIAKQKNNSSSADNSLNLNRNNFAPSLFLFSYALFFSLAYIQLGAAIGALILFASVQITMIGVSIYHGNRLTIIEWAGFTLALAGLIYLLLPGLTSPPIWGAIMMVLSGISWGGYSLLGKNQKDPVFSTARNFFFCLPGCLLLIIYSLTNSASIGFESLTSNGIMLAVLSGAVTSGLGYVLWYLTLRKITVTVASIAQLSVPIIAGFGGVLFLNEIISSRLIVSAFFITTGIVITIMGKRRAN